MRFGIKTMPQHTTWGELLALWQRADEIELFESAWTFDHFYPIYGDWAGPNLESWVTLSALAQATTRLRIGSMVNGMPYRHPALLAKMAAALDIVSNGRLELGLGAGWNQREAGAYGIDLGATLTERFDRFAEGLACVVALFRDDTVDFEGRYFTLTDARNEPKGPQQPHPPICIGGQGERRTLPLVARYAQHWNFPGGSPDVFRHKLAVLHEHCATIGRDPAEIVTSTHVPMWPDKTIDDVVRQAEAFAEAGIDIGLVYLQAPFAPGLLDDVASALAPLAG